MELCPFSRAGVEGLAPYLRICQFDFRLNFIGFSKPCFLQQGFLLLLLPCVLLRLKLLNMLQLLSFYEVFQANSSHQELGLERDKVTLNAKLNTLNGSHDELTPMI